MYQQQTFNRTGVTSNQCQPQQNTTSGCTPDSAETRELREKLAKLRMERYELEAKLMGDIPLGDVECDFDKAKQRAQETAAIVQNLKCLLAKLEAEISKLQEVVSERTKAIELLKEANAKEKSDFQKELTQVTENLKTEAQARIQVQEEFFRKQRRSMMETNSCDECSAISSPYYDTTFENIGVSQDDQQGWSQADQTTVAICERDTGADYQEESTGNQGFQPLAASTPVQECTQEWTGNQGFQPFAASTPAQEWTGNQGFQPLPASTPVQRRSPQGYEQFQPSFASTPGQEPNELDQNFQYGNNSTYYVVEDQMNEGFQPQDNVCVRTPWGEQQQQGGAAIIPSNDGYQRLPASTPVQRWDEQGWSPQGYGQFQPSFASTPGQEPIEQDPNFQYGNNSTYYVADQMNEDFQPQDNVCVRTPGGEQQQEGGDAIIPSNEGYNYPYEEYLQANALQIQREELRRNPPRMVPFPHRAMMEAERNP